jgi:hypothetical protein
MTSQRVPESPFPQPRRGACCRDWGSMYWGRPDEKRPLTLRPGLLHGWMAIRPIAKPHHGVDTRLGSEGDGKHFAATEIGY